MSDSWFFKHRQEWIAETVRIFGFINREHIRRKFEISTPQASIDIQHFIDANPGVLIYNRSSKRYEDVRPDDSDLRKSRNCDQCVACEGSGEIFRGVGGPDDPERCYDCDGTGVRRSRPAHIHDVRRSDENTAQKP